MFHLLKWQREKREEGRGKREEGRGKMEEGKEKRGERGEGRGEEGGERERERERERGGRGRGEKMFSLITSFSLISLPSLHSERNLWDQGREGEFVGICSEKGT